MPTAMLAATLFGFWLILSGLYTPFLVAAGAGVSLAVALLAWRTEMLEREGHPLHLAAGVLTYWPWLVKEIVVSGWRVARIIVHPRLPIAPSLVRFRPSQRTSVGLVTHANSISLTPGTVTVEAGHEEFLVHALTREAAAGLAGSDMDRRVNRLEGSL